MKKLISLMLIMVGVTIAQAPPYPIILNPKAGTSFPLTCNNGTDLFFNINTYLWYACGPNNTWNTWNYLQAVLTTFTPAQFGGDATGVADSSKAVTLCINAAKGIGGTCFYDSIYKQHNVNITIGTSDKTFTIAGCSLSCGFKDTTGDGNNSLTITFNQATRFPINLNNFSYVGPDSSGSTTTSGTGIQIIGTTVAPKVFVNNILGTGFLGSGKSAFYCVGCEDSAMTQTEFSTSDSGFSCDTSCNANSFVNMRVIFNNTHGIYCPSCNSNNWINPTAESNNRDGFYLQGDENTITSLHSELNNQTATVGICTVCLVSAIGNTITSPVFNSGGGGVIEKYSFTGASNENNVTIGGISSGLIGGISMDAFSPIQTFIDFAPSTSFTGATPFTRICWFAGCSGYDAIITPTENGTNGAIATPVSSGPPLISGLIVRIQLSHTLAAGANTFAYNAGTAVAIKSHRNIANNIGTGYATGGFIELLYDGIQWEDLSQ